MSLFEFLMILLSIIIGLGLSELLYRVLVPLCLVAVAADTLVISYLIT